MRTCLLTFTAIATLFTMSTAVLAQGLVTSTPDLPPDGEYVAPNEYHPYSAMGVVLDDPVHRPLVGTTVRTAIGDDELETFDSILDAVEVGMGLGPVQLSGPVQVITTDRLLSTTGLFDTEIISMNLSGMTPLGMIMVRESPILSSLGQTEITDIGGGLYHIDSFFDVFTELSVDGGQSWIPSDTSIHMYLVPEPAGVLLMLALVLVPRRRA